MSERFVNVDRAGALEELLQQAEQQIDREGTEREKEPGKMPKKRLTSRMRRFITD